MVLALATQNLSLASEIAERIALRLEEDGWSLTDQFVPPDLVAGLREEAQDLRRDGAYRKAGVGRRAGFHVRPDVRSDQVHWLDASQASPNLSLYLDALEGLRSTINRRLQLGLLDFEGHFAVYPPGGFYRKHLDQFTGIGERTLSCILYLNENWRPEQGGQLRIYTDPREEDRFEDIDPIGGRLVTFLSVRFPHEVVPAHRDRYSIAGWFCRRGQPMY